MGPMRPCCQKWTSELRDRGVSYRELSVPALLADRSLSIYLSYNGPKFRGYSDSTYHRSLVSLAVNRRRLIWIVYVPVSPPGKEEEKRGEIESTVEVYIHTRRSPSA